MLVNKQNLQCVVENTFLLIKLAMAGDLKIKLAVVRILSDITNQENVGTLVGLGYANSYFDNKNQKYQTTILIHPYSNRGHKEWFFNNLDT